VEYHKRILDGAHTMCVHSHTTGIAGRAEDEHGR
jgi:hypothetical protein